MIEEGEAGMSEWREFSLLELAEIHDEKRIPLSKMEREARRGNYPYYGASGIIDHIDNFLFDGCYLLISEDGENLKTRQTPIAFQASGRFWVNNHAHIIKGKNEYVDKLIMYAIESMDLHPFLTGAVQPKLNQENLLSIPFFLPESEPEQCAIASVLSSLDDKIDLLHRQNKTLEALAETLFRQWFVEEADEGWEEGKLNDIVTVASGTTPKTERPEYWDGEYHWTSPRDITNLNGLFLFETERKITKQGLEQIGSGLLPTGSLLMSSRAPVGALAFAEIPVAINQGYAGIICDKGFSREYIYLWLKTHMDYVQSHANGSTFQEISKSTFRELDLIIPDSQTRQAFHSLISPAFGKMKTNAVQIRTLEALRDTLLPKLMSGEVSVVV